MVVRTQEAGGTGGCVAAPDNVAKWIYDNCGRGTPVLIY